MEAAGDGMKVIIAGSRSITDYSLIGIAVERSGFNVTAVISGCAPDGIDHLGAQWAKAKHIPIERYPANWTKHGKAAGPIRNAEMAAAAEGLVAIWDGKSPGTRNMIYQMKRLGKPHYVLVAPTTKAAGRALDSHELTTNQKGDSLNGRNANST
jgi:hypothetical protein